MNLFFVKQPRLFFITIKSSKVQHQKIDYAHKMIKKVSSNYFIIRERNKINQGYHFHCLVSLRKECIQKKWFRKGVHIHVIPLKQGVPNIPESQDEFYHKKERKENILLADGIPKESIPQVIKAENKLRMVRSKCKKDNNIQKVLQYMNKDSPDRQYIDYIYVKDNVSHSSPLFSLSESSKKG